MSGSAAVLSFRFCDRNVFRKADMVWLNGVPVAPGPAPNERLGEIDTIIHGTAHSVDNPRYGGGHLFRDIVAGKEIEVKVRTSEGRNLKASLTLDDMTYARYIAIRNAFKNYVGFVNRSAESIKTIFSVTIPDSLLSVSERGAL
jgi:uncharacterized protein (DUF39 family)